MLTMRFAMVAQKASGLNKLPSVGANIHISTDDPKRAHDQPVLQINGEVTRDSCGPLLLAEGMNLVEVGGLLGHEDAKTTMKYLHPDTSGSAAIVNQRNHAKSLHLLKAAG
jgi:hypothetical protein